ncbi:MAG: Amuc_1100 family pilus-like protein [Pontiella sp.]
MNLPKNKRIVVCCVIFGIVLLIEMIFLVLANAELSKQKQELERGVRRLSQLHNRNPFPSSENVEALKENLDGLEYYFGELVSTVKGDPFPLDAVEAADFSARAQDVIERFQKRAELSGVVLPESLEVGFAEYASGGAVPDIRNVPRLSRQLYSVERVADVLVQSGVDSIDSLTRDMFEMTNEIDRSAPRRRSTRNAAIVSNDRKPQHLIASEVHPEKLYYIERIGVSFKAKESVVWRVLDQFASAPHFMVVSELSHSTERSILNYSPDAVKRGGAGDDDTLKYLAGGILVGEKALSRPERIIAGREALRIHLMVNVFNFETEVESK